MSRKDLGVVKNIEEAQIGDTSRLVREDITTKAHHHFQQATGANRIPSHIISFNQPFAAFK